ncbi:S8 family serine peptidase [Jiangella endophytica]|uniref:S8 family serine peptidase n=1 Tax=Jiangella endophytica TaxID=1623398 RepID=UPI00130049A5|nr:S8 family serine peptidase [Jiangella endophytica]
MDVDTSARRRRPHAILALTLLAMLLAALSSLPPAAAAQPATSAATQADQKLTTELRERFEGAEEKPQEFWVRFEEHADLSAAYDIEDWAERGEFVVRRLQETAATTQAGVADLLDARGVEYESYWISNTIRVTGAPYEVASEVAVRPEVGELSAPETFDLPEPEVTLDDGAFRTNAVEWGIADINADDVWADGIDGSGIVVGNIDTGVQFDHPVLVNQYRGNRGAGSFDHDYAWFDPTGTCVSAACDNQGHGTHTMGTMVGADGGANQVGVAPGATWIAAKGCMTDSCGGEHLMAAGQWMLAPTRIDGTGADPSMRPDIINNSWGGGSSADSWYDNVTAAWAAAGIFGVWSNGNSGPACRTSTAPGGRTANYSVGAYDVQNTIASFSSRGAGQDGEIKPNLSAPGVNVRSAYPGGRYALASGTSMAAPHVAGAVALLWSAAPDLVGDLQATRDLLDTTAVNTEDAQCGGDGEDNNVYGEGRLDALAMVTGRTVGVLTGTVTDRVTGAPVAAARVRVVGGPATHPIDRTVAADASGQYRAGLPAGEYQITASAYGYVEDTAAATVVESEVTTVDVPLDPAPMTTVTGRVADGSGHGWPVHAEVTVAGVPQGSLFTDQITGEYTVTLPAQAEYSVTVDPVYPGYPATLESVAVGDTAVRVDHIIAADMDACTAPGYGRTGHRSAFTGWSGDAPRDGWLVGGLAGSWRFDNPRQRPQPPGGQGAFPIADPAAAPRGRVDATLTSPAFDLSDHSAPVLRVDMRYLGAPRRQSAEIEYSIDGRTWSTVWSASTETVIGTQSIELPGAAGQHAVRVRFSFTGSDDSRYWGFDNLFLGTWDCVPLDGGLVVGGVRDATTGEGLANVRIRVGSAPESVVWSQQLDDQGVTGAPFWLFAAGDGIDRIEAQVTGYEPYASDLSVTPHAITHHDIALTGAAPAGLDRSL